MPAMPGVLGKSPSRGLSLSYTNSANYWMQNIHGQSYQLTDQDRFEFKLKVPLVIKPSFVALLGFNYQEEEYQFFDQDLLTQSDQLINTLQTTELSTARFSAYVTKSLNSKMYMGIRTEVLFSGGYEGLKSQELRYRATGVLGYKSSAYTEYGFGIFYANNFGRQALYPFAYYNHTINRKWGLEFLIPARLKVRHNINDKQILLFGPGYERGNYALDIGEGTPYPIYFRRHAISFSATYMYNLKGWLWMEAEAGYNYNLRNRVDDTVLQSIERMSQGSAPYVKVGFFLSPGKK